MQILLVLKIFLKIFLQNGHFKCPTKCPKWKKVLWNYIHFFWILQNTA